MDLTVTHHKQNILFVDDEENVLRSLQRLFADEEYEVYTAISAEKGLDALKENEIAVIVSDMRMPGMSGVEFLERARELYPDSIRIVLSGYADANVMMDAINKGSTHRYVTKPWNDDELVSTIRDSAERYRLTQENRYLTGLTLKQNEELKKWSAELELNVQEQTIELTYKHKEVLELNEKLKTDFRGFIITMANLIELREETFANHSNQVAMMARKMARTIGLNDQDTQDVAIAAQLHDIGKIGIPDAILLKEVEDMAPFELHEYQSHSVRGQTAVDSIDAMRTAGIFIRHHHESFDGNGFPGNLKADQIPLGARIITIADKYDRLSAKFSVKETLEKINYLAGSLCDPNLCRVLTAMLKNNPDPEQRNESRVESEKHPGQLSPGMVLSRELRSGTGVLLLPQGARLSSQTIDSVKRHYILDPPHAGIYVWS